MQHPVVDQSEDFVWQVLRELSYEDQPQPALPPAPRDTRHLLEQHRHFSDLLVRQELDWSEHPNLWGGVVSRPGRLKSPAISDALKPLGRVERLAQKEYDDALLEHVARDFLRKSNLEALQRQIKAAAKKGTFQTTNGTQYQQLLQLQQAEPEPKIRQYRTNDSTVEKLAELCSTNPRGLLVQRDELVGLLAGCAKQGHEGDRAFYLEGWNGHGQYTQDRIGRGTITVDNLCLSLFGGIQPGRLQDYMYGAESGQNDGFLQRFQVLVYPDEKATWQLVDQAPDRDALDAVNSIVERLAQMDFVAMGAKDDKRGAAPYFRFHPKAQALFNAWLADLEDRTRTEEDALMAEHLSKYRKLVPGLALIFHLVDIAAKDKPQRRVAPEALQRALRWEHYLESHARRIYGLVTDYVLLAAQSLSRKIEDGELENGFSERDVRRKGWSYLQDDELVRAACQELAETGWIRRIQAERNGPGRPVSPTYEINPALIKK